MTPTPRPMSRSPGANAQALGEPLHEGEQDDDPGDRGDEAGDDERPLRVLLGEPFGRERGQQDAAGGGGEDHAGLDGVVAPDDLQVGGDDEGGAHEQEPLHVLGDQPEVRRAVAEQSGRQQGLLVPAFAGADVEEEQGEERPRRPTSRTAMSARSLSAARTPITTRMRPAADRTAPRVSKGRVGVGRDGIDDVAAQPEDHGDDDRLEDERGPPTDGGGDEPADQRSGGGADAAHPGDDPEGPRSRRDIAEEQRGEDVHGRDQQRGANPFEDRVAEYEDAETRERLRSSARRSHRGRGRW